MVIFIVKEKKPENYQAVGRADGRWWHKQRSELADDAFKAV